MSPFARRAGLVPVFILIAAAFAAPAFASFPEHTDAVPSPAIDPGFPVILTSSTFSLPPQFVDLDLDGKHEILAVTDNGTMYMFGVGGLGIGGGFPLAFGKVPSGPPAVGDLNLDGRSDIVIAFTSGVVNALRADGGFVFSVTVPGVPVGGPVLAELDGSGRLSVLVATKDGKLHALDPTGEPVPGFPVTGPGPAVGGAFTFLAGENVPRVGYLADPGGAAVWMQNGSPDVPYSFNPGVPVGAASPVSGPRREFGLSDLDHLYMAGKGGGLWRFDPDEIDFGSGDATPLTGVSPTDSIVDTPCLFDANDDLAPELAVRSLRGDTLKVWIKDGEAGATYATFPKAFPGSAPGGGIAAADLGEGGTPEIVFNHGPDKVSCFKVDGTLQWTLVLPFPAKSGPALGDLDGDGAMDMAVLTNNGRIYCYTLGNAGIGPRGIEWPNYDGTPDHGRRHHARDHAAPRPQWPARVSPPNAYVGRPVFADVTGDGFPETIWSDSLLRKTYVIGQGTDSLQGYPQTYNSGSIMSEAPAVGDVTGDGVDETVQSTASGFLVWGNRNGQLNSMSLDTSNRILTPPVLADINNDGTLDAVVGSSSNRLYAVNLINKTIIPGFPVTTAGAISLPPAVGDVNGDGQTDIVVVSDPRNITAYPRTGVTPLAGWPRTFPSGSTLTQPILVPVTGNTGLAVSFGQARTDSVFAHLVGANSANRPGWPRALAGTAIYGPVAGDVTNDGQPDFAFSSNTDSMYVFVANGNRALTRFVDSGGDIEVAGFVDVDLDQRPDLIAVSDHSQLLAVRFNGLLSRAFDHLVLYVDNGMHPAFGDLGGDGVMDMALSDLGSPFLFSFGFGSWDARWAPWPMKGHDPRRSNAFSGKTVVGAFDAEAPIAALGWARALPNPARGRIALTHSRPLAGRYEAAIYDLRGRLVRHVARGEARAGDGAPSWTWDGVDDHGSAAAPGVYFYRVVDRDGSLATRIVRL